MDTELDKAIDSGEYDVVSYQGEVILIPHTEDMRHAAIRSHVSGFITEGVVIDDIRDSVRLMTNVGEERKAWFVMLEDGRRMHVGVSFEEGVLKLNAYTSGLWV